MRSTDNLQRLTDFIMKPQYTKRPEKIDKDVMKYK